LLPQGHNSSNHKLLKILTAESLPKLAYCSHRNLSVMEIPIMAAKTCAACDCVLDSTAIKVTVGRKTVEVCCEECAQKLKDGQFSSNEVGQS
jgi:hypothetical protein